MTGPQPNMSSPIRDEFSRSPVGTTFTALGGAAGLGSLIIALILSGFQPSSGPNIAGVIPLSTYLFALAGFLGVTSIAAVLSRAAMRLSGIASFFISIALASVSILITKLILVSFGIRFPISGGPRATTDELIYRGTVLIFLAVTAERVVTAMAAAGEEEPRKPSDRSDDETVAMIFAGPIVLGIWGVAVRAGEAILVSGQF